MKKSTSVTCVIPAYNECHSIRHTLEAVIGAGDTVDEIIVVDDGSSDGTADIVRQFPTVRLFNNEKNGGKSYSIARGITEARGEYVLMLDADLLGLEVRNIRALVEPIVAGKADVSISIRGNTPGWMKAIKVDFMSGERVWLRATLLPHLGAMGRVRGFGLELFLNRIIIRNRLRIASVYMENVNNHMKWKKRGFWRGISHEANLWREVFSIVSPLEWVMQNVRMRKLVVPDEA